MCYRFFRGNTTLRWTSAEKSCEHEHGGHLVSIRDKEDMDFIHSLIIDNGPSRASKIYIGEYHFCVKKCWLSPSCLLQPS